VPYERIETDTEVQFYGAAFVDVVETHKPIVVDGDLVASRIAAPSIRLTHGSLICPKIECPLVDTEILGTFDLTQPVPERKGWTYRWLRPILPECVPDESRWMNVDSIRSVAALFQHPALIGQATKAQPFIARALARPSCARARVLFDSALDELTSEAALLTPLGQQTLMLFLLHEELPSHWRF
jgi:hypothetical protein